MLFMIGLGLGDAKDITVKGLEIVKSCDFIYLEAYTSILTCGKEELVSNALAFTAASNQLKNALQLHYKHLENHK